MRARPMAPKLTMEEVKRVIPKKQILGTGSRTDRTGHGRRTKRFLLVQTRAIKMKIKS